MSGDRDPFATAFVLAAVAAGDGTASRGAVSPELGERIRRVALEVRGAMQRDRDVAVRELAGVLRLEVVRGEALSIRARGIVATLAPRALGAGWMREAPLPRAGFRTSAALRRTLAALSEAEWRA